MSHTTSSARRAAAQRLLLETTLFQEETSLPRLQALLTTLEDQPPPRFFRRGILAAAAGHPSRLLPPSPRPRLEAMGPGGKRRGPGRPGPPSPRPDKGERPARPPPFPGPPVSQVIPTSAGLAALCPLAYLENLAPPSACPDVENLPFFLPGDTAPGHLPFDPEDKTQSIFLLEDASLSPAPFSQDSVQNIPSEPASPETP